MNKKDFTFLRRGRLAKLVTDHRRSKDFTQRQYCDWIVEQTQNAQEFGAFIDDLTYGALQAWENPTQRGSLPSVDNFWALSKILGFSSIDQLLLYLGQGILNPSVQEDKFDKDQLQIQVLSMDRDFKIKLLKLLQNDLLSE
jgi:hypothetical protein